MTGQTSTGVGLKANRSFWKSARPDGPASIDLMINADIPMMPIHDFRNFLADPHFEAAGFFRFTEHPTEGRIRELAVSASFSRNTPTPSRPTPRHGAQGTEIPREIGYSEEEIARLRSGNIVGPIAPGSGRNHGKTREGRS